MTKRICDVEDCDNPHEARGFCAHHYHIARRAGLPPKPPYRHRLTEIDREALTATCHTCGPGTPILVVSGGRQVRCPVGHEEAKVERRAKRKAETPEQRARRNEYHRNYNRAAKYKIKVEVGLRLLLDAASWKCEICAKPLTERTARIDHDHACCDSNTETCGSCVRGILCNSCNTGLGLLADDSRRLARAIEYLDGQLPLTA